MRAPSGTSFSVQMRRPLRYAVTDRVGIGYALVDNCSREEACDAIVSHAKAGGKPTFVATANAQHIVLLDQDKRLREIYDRADLVVPDGFSLLLAARFYGRVSSGKNHRCRHGPNALQSRGRTRPCMFSSWVAFLNLRTGQLEFLSNARRLCESARIALRSGSRRLRKVSRKRLLQYVLRNRIFFSLLWVHRNKNTGFMNTDCSSRYLCRWV